MSLRQFYEANEKIIGLAFKGLTLSIAATVAAYNFYVTFMGRIEALESEVKQLVQINSDLRKISEEILSLKDTNAGITEELIKNRIEHEEIMLLFPQTNKSSIKRR